MRIWRAFGLHVVCTWNVCLVVYLESCDVRIWGVLVVGDCWVSPPDDSRDSFDII